MHFAASRVWRVAAVWVTVFAVVSSQLTFSRDWAGGKRAAPQISLDCGQFTRLCRHFVHELKQAMSTRPGRHRPRGPDAEDNDQAPAYDDE